MKDLICRVFGNRQDEIDDSDLVLTIRGLHYSEPKTEFILKNDELKEIFEKVNSAQIHGLELLVEHKYEVAVEIDRPIIHTMEFPQVSLDKENNIEYQIGLCSVEYCVFLLITLIEKSKQQNKALSFLVSKGLVQIELSEVGICYYADKFSEDISKLLDCNYSRKYAEYVRRVDGFFGQKTECEINKYAGNNIGNWKSSLEKGEK